MRSLKHESAPIVKTAPPSSLLNSRAARVTLVMSLLFAASGVLMVFLPRWLEFARGLSGEQIGAVLSLAQVARIVTGPAIALWAEGVADWRTPLRVIAAAAIAAFAVFFFLAHDFASLLLAGFVALSLMLAMTPLVEAAALRATAQGAISYGHARGIGSIAFIVATSLGGLLVSRFGVGAVVVWVLAALAFTAASAWFNLPADAKPASAPRARPRFAGIRDLLGNTRFLILIVACGLIQSAHGFYYGFSTLVWRGQGMSDATAGLLWSFGVAVEVVFLWSLAPIERRVSPTALILAGAAGALVRWAAMGFAPTGSALWLLQVLHTLSFAATHVGAMRLLYRETPEHNAAMAQMLYAAAAGLLMGASTQLSGFLYQADGAQGYWAMAALAGAGGLLALGLLGAGPALSKR